MSRLVTRRGHDASPARLGRAAPAVLRITKAGDALLRRLLVTAADSILGPFGADTALRRQGLLRISERGGQAAKKRAILAVARKLAVLLHRLWVTGEIYQPLGYDASVAKAA